MPVGRPDIPAKVEREVLMEAGHRCAIPTCRQPTVEIHHIVPWSQVRTHEAHNLIALCPNDHRLAGEGKIDRVALRGYKHNLAIVNSRYSQAEHRLLDMFARGEDDDWELEDGTQVGRCVRVDSNRDFDFYYLLEDGLLRHVDTKSVSIGDVPIGPQLYALTEDGQAFVERLRTGMSEPLED